MPNMDIEKIYSDYFKIVYKYLLCLTHNQEITEDLTQETFYKAINNISKFRGDCKISVWLCQIAKNLWYNELKKNNRISTTDIDLLDIAAVDNIEENFSNKENAKEIYQKFLKLDETMRKIVYLKLYGNLTFKQIGDIMGKTEVWARVNFYRAKQKIREVNQDEK